MVGRITFPQSEEKTVDTQSAEDPLRPPAYSDAAYFADLMTTTVTTTTQTTTHFFSLPLWRRRAGSAMVSAASEDPHAPPVHMHAEEDGRISQASSFNVDKELPAVPHYENILEPPYTRKSSSSSSRFLSGTDTNAQGAGPSGSSTSTLMPPQSQSARSLVQAGLGIGLPLVMPLAASSPRMSLSSSARPSTAPRPTRRESSLEIRRVKSFSRARSEGHTNTSGMGDTSRSRKKSATLLAPKSDEVGIESGAGMRVVPGPSTTSHEPKSLMRRASFWSRRRVQSLKDPDAQNAVHMSAQASPVPLLPTFQAVSPLFPERDLQNSPRPSPHSPNFRSSKGLRRRHSERSASSSHHSPLDSNFITDPPPIPNRSPQRPRNSGGDRPPDSPAAGSGSSAQSHRPVPTSFITSPTISRFPPVDGRSRPRSITNPPNLLHRLSMGFFNPSSPSSPISSPTVSTNITDAMPLSSSPRHSAILPRSSLSKTNVDIPKPRANEESPDIFLGRLEEAVSKAEIANVLAGNGDPFYSQALQVYIDRFDFTNDPLDIALRKLLMDVGLPKETQQIDRVMEAFAASYTKCNPGLFMSEDHPYILAFSLIMLHTDAFNKSNKRKMSKPDYIKNTKLVGVSAEVLDYFYDNTVFAPFIFIEDPVDVNGQRGLFQDGRTQSSSSGQATPTASGSGLSMLGKSNKIDPYYLITRNLLGPLRIEVESYIPLRNPYSYQGTAGSWNEGELRRSFARADVIEVDTMDAKRMSTLPFFSMNVSGAPGPMITSFAGQTVSEPESSLSELSTLRVTKVGLLNRKDDVSDGGKRASSRKWREWSVILTGSQLLFFRDSAMALDLIAQSHSSENKIFSAQFSFLRPDEHVSVKDAIAVYDSSYAKHGNVVRLVMATGRQILLQAESEIQRNEWIAHINYTSAFKTAGIRMRPVSATEEARMDAGSYTLDAMRIPSDLNGSASDVVYKDEDKNMSVPSRQAPNGDAINLRVHLSSPDETSKTQSRSRIVLSKIHEFEMKIKTTRAQLDSDIRVVRNLAVLTPFQRTTRDRLQASVITLSRHIKQLRLEVVKTACYRDVLAADLASEDRERRRSRKDVLEAEDHVRKTNSHIPKMTLSVHEDDLRSQSLPHSDMTDSRPESSICESFHSALDFGSDWPLNVRLPASPQSKTKQSFESSSPLPTPSCEIGPDSIKTGFFPPTILDKISARPSLSSSPTLVSSRSLDGNPSFEETHRSGPENVDQEITEEQAEEWDKTRAGRRVSLVRVPIGLRASRHDKERRRHNMRTETDYNDTKLSGDDVISDV